MVDQEELANLSSYCEEEESRNSIYGAYSNFSIERIIGKGQFSTVHRAICKLNDRHVALKRVQLCNMVDPKARMDCMKEIELLKKLNHPNVIQYLGSFLEDGQLFIVLNLADAGDLSRMIKYFRKHGRLIPEKTIWKYFTQICSAVEHMHSRRILHRDIKPANVFVTAEGVVKLGDLGLGRYFSSKTVAAHTLVGTPYYMAPERIDEKGYNFKSDVWSMGCLLYELAALKSPFYAERMTLHGLCRLITSCIYPPIPSDIYSQDLRMLVRKCIDSDPVNRPDVVYLHERATQLYKSFSSAETSPKKDTYLR